MRLYSTKYKRNVERQIHFGVGKSVHTACGLVLFSRHVMVSIHSGNDGALITDDISRVTCKRCLACKEARLRKLIAIEQAAPGIFDRGSLCGENWLLNNALTRNEEEIKSQMIEVTNGEMTITLSENIKAKDRKYVLRSLVTK